MLINQPLPPSGQRIQIEALVGSADALAISELATLSRPVVVLAANALDAQRLLEEIRWFSPKLTVSLLPDWETLPYDHFSPHQDLISERLATLYQISQSQCDIAIVPVTTALYRLTPPTYLGAYTFFLKQGQKLDVDALRQQMIASGYSAVSQVISPGEFSVRGGLLDLFPMGSALPYRIDLFDDEIETIRTFDVDTQRSIYPVKEIRLLPAREFPLDEAGMALFRQNFRDHFEGDASKRQIYKDVSNGLAPAGIEYYLPLFFEKTASLFDYVPDNAVICLHGDIETAASEFWRDTETRYKLMRGDPQRPILPPADLFLAVDALYGHLKHYARVEISQGNTADGLTRALPDLSVERRADDPLHRIKGFLAAFKGKILLLAESLGRRETMTQYFSEHGVKLALCEDYSSCLDNLTQSRLGVAPLTHGFILQTTPPLAFITESELYATTIRTRNRTAQRRTQVDGMLRDLSEVKVGDPVVHADHGIGRYLGLVSMDLGEGETEFLLLEYAGNDKLYVPVSQLHLIGRYSGAAAESVTLSKLGSGQWEKAKRRAMEQARDTAAELLNLYARRAARQGHAFTLKQHDYEAFVEGFGFEETIDQASAIEAVIADLCSPRPMDRLVCGDVGFGKTEVALRAAFVALMDGRQVAVLVPTTLLAEQHFQNFSDRFADWPVRIAELSRFRSAKEQTQALAGLAAGTIDIVIGTHKLLQKDVIFKNLGLVIIDEEHRFGVRQKEQMKVLRSEIDVLTLTATPIPRTLAMSLEGIRDFSVITTPPQKRLSIKTFVSRYSDGVIREAVLRELKRGGQVYFLHNEVDTIYNMEAKLTKLLPEARIRVAHGQMPERELEHVMRDFHQQQVNVLLCTTIIETGIDIPTANTIIMNRADKFGLAQLHQLRGRVGRSHHQAYAYLMTPEEDAITPAAKKRLEALQMMEDLGAGFHLAMHDLEIRGAGEVLGDSQSGSMQEIGFSMYNDMLNHAVAALKKGLEPDMNQPLGVTTEINLHTPALLPDSYCGDIHERLVLYKRLANCSDQDGLDDLHAELVDRFGVLPEPAQALLESHRLRLLAKPLGIAKLDASSEAISLQFIPKPPIDPARLIELIQTRRHYKLAGPDKLRVTIVSNTLTERVKNIRNLLKELS
ncbi:transcription-repair coupling factor [Sulfuriferula thiophila]|uniref:transcription-repair coupling factor n=1 Tax=Sulfuriferula thiophila TaxID=1781211 RepID=UPI000F60C20B|nr:transcription-repair coupling factor [Sulfuriferula thiophila]